MRVLCVIPQMGPGGAERVMASLITGLSSRHSVSLLTWESPGTAPFFELPESALLLQAGLFGGRGFERFRRIASRFLVLRRHVRMWRPDVVLSFLDTTNLTTVIACLGTGVPVVVSERVDPARHDLGQLLMWMRLRIYPWADRLVVQTRRVTAYFPWRMQAQIVELPNPIAPASAVASPATPRADGRFRIVAMGRLVPQKGFDRLIDAFARLAGRHQEWDVVIFGEGPYRAALEQQAHAAGVRGRVTLAGVNAASHTELAASHLFAFPSRFEGFPNALGEAMAAGLPAVGYDGVSGVEEMIEDGITGVLLHETADTEALASALDLLMRDAALRARMGTAAVTRAARWAEDLVMARWEGLLAEVVSTRTGTSAR
jgi:GalNAc-alpha-(1->4)-GalNAc-alpha-(1->3)-diNAcBac-PP-undecaprenol alpha-1,4-N-acetyl-D-galactosaminyltransferase